jgi:hypothetical protein
MDFSDLGVERIIGHVVGVEVESVGLEICHASRHDSGIVSSATELKVSLDHNLQLLLQLNSV